MTTRYALVGIALVSSIGLASATVKKVALKGEQTPQPGIFYRKFSPPVVCDAPGAHVAVYDRSPGKRCIFKLDPDAGPDTTVACEKDSSPDSARRFQRFGPETINATATVAWSSRIEFGRNGIFRGDPTKVDLVGDPVPAPGTGLLDKLSFASITDTGDVAFESTISGSGAKQGLFRCTGGDGNCSSGGTGTLQTVLLAGDPVPDRAGRAFCTFEGLAASTFGIAFRALTKLDCSNNGETALDGVFRKPTSGSATTIALVGEGAAPFPNPGGTTYAGFVGGPAIENLGAVAFVASTVGPGGTSAVYRCDPGTCPASPALALVIRGDLDGNGNAFRTFSPPAISAARDVAFNARSTGPAGIVDGVYVRRQAGPIDTIAKTGDTVPNYVPTSVFRVLVTPPSMSAAGKVAFKSRIRRSVSPRNLEGVFVSESPSGAFLE